MIRYKNGNNETDNLKFLLSLLVIIGTFLYTIHIYFQNTAINIDLYEYVKIFISVVLCYLFIIILYITLKSFSIEIQDINTKKYLNLLSSSLYLIGLSFFIMIIIFIISFYICLKIDNSFSSEMYERIPFLNIFITSLVLIKIIKREVCTDNKTILDIMNSIDNPKYLGIILISGIFMIFTANKLIIYSVIIICIVYVAYSEKKKLTLELLPVSYKIFTTVIVPILVVLFFIISASSLFLFSGQISSYIMEIHLTNDMESIYYKNDIQIPVTIQVTGINTDLSVYLAKEDSEHNLIYIDDIILKPEHNSKNITSSEVLVGNALGYGKFNIFINISNMTTGYYELKYNLSGFNEKYDAKGFYLLDDNFN